METTLTQPTTLANTKEKVKKIFPSAKFRFSKVVTYGKMVKHGAVYVGGKPLSSLGTEDIAWNKAFQSIVKAIQL